MRKVEKNTRVVSSEECRRESPFLKQEVEHVESLQDEINRLSHNKAVILLAGEDLDDKMAIAIAVLGNSEVVRILMKSFIKHDEDIRSMVKEIIMEDLLEEYQLTENNECS